MLIDDFAQKLNSKIGVTQTMFGFLILLWPLTCWVLPKFKTRKQAAIFQLAYGFFMCYFLFGPRVIFAVFLAVSIYPFLECTPSYVFISAFLINSVTHIYHMIYTSNGWSMAVTGTCIVIFQKIISVSYNLLDGRIAASGEKLKHDRYNLYKLDKKPSFLEWLAYCFTAYGGSTGPFIEFRCFEHLITMHEREHIAADSVDRKMAIKRYLGSLGWAIATLISFKYCNKDSYSQPWYTEQILLVRVIIMFLITCGQAIKYFTAWFAVEAALFESGLLSADFTDKLPLPSFSNLSLLKVFESPSIGDWMKRWNHTTHLCWRNYLFTRLLDSGYGYTIAYNAVFIMSAAWHGFRPAYYLILPELWVAMQADSMMLKRWPLDTLSGWQRALRSVWVVGVMMLTMCAWWFGTAESFFALRKSVCFAPQVLVVAVFVVMKLLPRKAKTTEEKKKD